jgi:hypothetical protein
MARGLMAANETGAQVPYGREAALRRTFFG